MPVESLWSAIMYLGTPQPGTLLYDGTVPHADKKVLDSVSAHWNEDTAEHNGTWGDLLFPCDLLRQHFLQLETTWDEILEALGKGTAWRESVVRLKNSALTLPFSDLATW